jgi:L-serine dehydratase
MQRISVFDMLKVGVGPSSSHTMGPWRAAQRFLREADAALGIQRVARLQADLYGSLAKTGRGHGTDVAVWMGLSNVDFATMPANAIDEVTSALQHQQALSGTLERDGEAVPYRVPFVIRRDIIFHFDHALPFHPNALRLTAWDAAGAAFSRTYYSVGGGFIITEGEDESPQQVVLPYPCDTAEDVSRTCRENRLALWQMVWHNEQAWRSEAQIHAELQRLWHTMLACVYQGCHAQASELPGGLRVARRARELHRNLIGEAAYHDAESWLEALCAQPNNFQDTVKWVSCFALAVNEENAAFGRVVTAPTNGAAGVIPAVLMHYATAHHATLDQIERFLMVAGEIGSLFKKGATISAAMGGCQAEIGVSSAMAAAALAEGLGGSVDQALMAAEIAMEHHLGLTCDPVGGLVQIPCIERNAMGAMKAITAAHLALESAPEQARISLDAVIRAMWQTAQDMNTKYKETAEGGLALQISVNLAEC